MSKNDKRSSVFFIKKGDAKKGGVWSDTAKQRFIKQHGSVDDIPEGDAHAVPVYDDPTLTPPPSAEESKSAIESLEKKLETLKEQKEPQPTEKPKKDNFY
jgi:hypothetical protein